MQRMRCEGREPNFEFNAAKSLVPVPRAQLRFALAGDDNYFGELLPICS